MPGKEHYFFVFSPDIGKGLFFCYDFLKAHKGILNGVFTCLCEERNDDAISTAQNEIASLRRNDKGLLGHYTRKGENIWLK